MLVSPLSIASDRFSQEARGPAPRPDLVEAGSAARSRSASPATTPECCARWARSEGIGLGDAVAVMVRDPHRAAALRLGLAWVGARTVTLEPALAAEALAQALESAGTAIVDTTLADAYAGALPHLNNLPAVWWNGPGADFASLDRALAEDDSTEL